MTEQSKRAKNWSLIIGLSIPVVMIIFIALSVYLPRFFDNTPAPTFNFLYISGNSYTHRLEVKDNHLEWIDNNRTGSKKSDDKPRIYLHDVSTNKNTEISFSGAQKLTLDARQNAPDGYSVKRNSSHGFFLFDHRRSRNHHLVNGHSSHKLELEYKNNYYYGFNFLGWIIE